MTSDIAEYRRRNGKTRLVMGVDPGFSGAIAVVEETMSPDYPFAPRIVGCWDMPLLPKNPRDPAKPQIDLPRLSFLIESYASDLSVVLVEDVHAMPGMGVVAMFRFGFTLGAMMSALAAHGLDSRTRKIRPVVWKRRMNLSTDKQKSIILAKRIFPEQGDTYFKLKKHDGRAEACLLAHYGAQAIFF